jgi:hypothetical protein
MQPRHALVGALALVAASLLAAGCGGGSKTPGVANIGTSTNDDSSASGGSNGDGTKGKNGAAFSACMRSHGIRNFPDPSTEGGLEINPSMGIDPTSPRFKTAAKACQKLLDIKPPSAAERAKMQEQALKYSACMRAHGVPKFPDPTFSGGGAQLKIDSSSGIDQNSPAFKAAEKACQDVLPGAKTRQVVPGGGVQSQGKVTGP